MSEVAKKNYPLSLTLMAALMLLLAIFGKGGAYFSIGGIFITEYVLMSALALCFISARSRMVHSWSTAVLLLFIIWSAMRTYPYIGLYGIDALRDAVLWGYSLVAFIIAASWRHPVSSVISLTKYFYIVLIAIPLSWTVVVAYGDQLPVWSGTAVPIINPKASDLQVHLAVGIVFLGCFAPRTWLRTSVICVSMCTLLALAAITRGGMVAAIFMLLGAVVLSARFRGAIRTMAAPIFILCCVALLIAPAIDLSMGHHRRISADQLADNVASLVDHSDNETTNHNTNWRLEWWGTICEYTIFGQYFIAGKGYGINLADNDGFQVHDDGSLRSPHNVHMTILARSGMVGLLLWLLFLTLWTHKVYGIVRVMNGDHRDDRDLAVIIMLAAWSWLINASFDVCLEGPMGGIWFWAIIGAGWSLSQSNRIANNPDFARADHSFQDAVVREAIV